MGKARVTLYQYCPGLTIVSWAKEFKSGDSIFLNTLLILKSKKYKNYNSIVEVRYSQVLKLFILH